MADVGKVDGIDIDDIGKINLMTVPAGGVAFTDYHYYEDLASAATYTPPVTAFATLLTIGGIESTEVNIEFWDGGAWVTGAKASPILKTCGYIFQDANQNQRVINDDGVAKKIGLTGVIWGSSNDYHYYEDLASGASYTPTAKSIFALLVGAGWFYTAQIELDFWDGGGWIESISDSAHSTGGELLCQDNSQNMRISNDRISALKISLTGITWT
jgi:hypothetical protein